MLFYNTEAVNSALSVVFTRIEHHAWEIAAVWRVWEVLSLQTDATSERICRAMCTLYSAFEVTGI